MSIHYIIDGYNVLKQMSELTGRSLKYGREELVKYLKTSRPQGSFKNEITIVFDGRSNVYVPHAKDEKNNVEIVFSQDETADEKIQRIIKRSPIFSNIIVVTNDKGLRYIVRQMGVKVLFVHNFIKRKKTKSDVIGLRKKTDLSPHEQIVITEELKKIWT